MGLSPSGCMFSFSLYLIRHKFRIAGLGFFFSSPPKVAEMFMALMRCPVRWGLLQPMHLLTAWDGLWWRGNMRLVRLGLWPLYYRAWEEPYQGSLWSWPLTGGIRWSGANLVGSDRCSLPPPPPVRGSVVQGRALLGAIWPSWVRGCWCRRVRELIGHVLGAASGLQMVLRFLLVEAMLRRGARCI